jgi:predicted choloylglycine hydrolase
MNQAGLCLARHEVLSPTVKRTYNPRGVPFAICFREVLETCRSVPEAIRLIERTQHVTVNNLVLCDASGGTICEITPDGVRSRPFVNELGACTNHFLHPEFVNPNQPDDYETLDRLKRLETSSQNAPPRVRLEEVQQAMHGVHQRDLTLQTMIFEPSAQTIHVAFGEGPVTANRLVPLDLTRFWPE